MFRNSEIRRKTSSHFSLSELILCYIEFRMFVSMCVAILKRHKLVFKFEHSNADVDKFQLICCSSPTWLYYSMLCIYKGK